MFTLKKTKIFFIVTVASVFLGLVGSITLQWSVAKAESMGSIEVCYILVDQDYHILRDFSDTNITKTIFTTELTTHKDDKVTVLKSPTITTKNFTPNVRIVGLSNDAQCFKYAFPIDTFFYRRETITGAGSDQWKVALYNDQDTMRVNALKDFFPIDGENDNSDGTIVLHGSSANRRLVVLNQLKVPIEHPSLPATISVVKKVINNDGGNKQVSDFKLFIGGLPTSSGVAKVVEPGTYKVSETQLVGYNAGAWEGDCAADGTVNVKAGDNKICTITNDDIALPPPTGCIAIYKHAYDEHDAEITPVPTFAFNIDGAANNVVYTNNAGTAFVYGLSVGSHTVSENVPSGWASTSVEPALGAVSVSAGDSCAPVIFKNKQNAAPIPDIIGSCSSNPSVAYTSDPITYSASATGGTGTYTYAWTGDEGISGSGQSIQASYSTAGVKNVHVLISSGDKSVTKDCGALVVERDQPLNGSCSANPGTAKTGEQITYTASATGGTTTVPYTYFWTGDDGLSGTSQSVQKTYTAAGTKNATVDITSGTETISKSCSATVTEPATQTGCIVISKEARSADNALITPTPEFTFTVDGAGSYTTNSAGTVQISNLPVGSHTVAENPKAGWTLASTSPELVGGSVNVSAGSSCTFVTFKNKQDSAANPAIIGSCSANPSTAHPGNPITFTASASGGTGIYSYAWSGEPNLTGVGTSTQVSYSTTGTKTMTVNISSGTSSISASCSALVNEEAATTSQFALTCAPNVSSATTGSTVTFTASASGGAGNYQYAWSGDDSLAGTSATTNHTYTSAGTKNATITATSSGQVLTAQCSLQINNPPVNPPVTPPSGGGGGSWSSGGSGWGYQISTVPTPTPVATPVPQVAGVFLSQVPYTGIGDDMKVMFFLFALFSWSAWIAYMIIKRKSRTLAVLGISSYASTNIESETAPVADPRLDILRSNKNELLEVLEYRAREQRAIVSAPALEMIMERATQQNHTALSMLDSAIAIYTKGRDESERDWTTISTEKISTVLQSL